MMNPMKDPTAERFQTFGVAVQTLEMAERCMSTAPTIGTKNAAKAIQVAARAYLDAAWAHYDDVDAKAGVRATVMKPKGGWLAYSDMAAPMTPAELDILVDGNVMPTAIADMSPEQLKRAIDNREPLS